MRTLLFIHLLVILFQKFDQGKALVNFLIRYLQLSKIKL